MDGLSPRYFEYPLSVSKIEDKKITNIELQKGDILYARHGNGRSYLLTEEPKKPIYAHNGTFVIRLKDSSISPEYLLLYLQSDTGRKYAKRHAQGKGQGMAASQFYFLQNEFIEIYKHARRAEELALSDPRSACFYARLSLETAIKWMYLSDKSLRSPYERLKI